MARYIDLEELERRIKEHIKPATLEEKALIEWCKDECIRQAYCMPTADVVPKSEVEELIRENESLAKTVNEASELIHKLRSKVEESKTEVVPTVSKMEQVRLEVAREIFAEIDRAVENSEIEWGTIYGVKLCIAELKKKYTEEK